MAKIDLPIRLYVSELFYDIQNKTFLHSRSIDNGQNPEQVSNMQAGLDDEDRNFILRSIASSYRLLRSELSEWLPDDSQMSDNILIDTNTELGFNLTLPANYNKAALHSLSEQSHKFIVDNVLAEWMLIHSKADAEAYVRFAAADLALIKDAMYKRCRPKRTIINEQEQQSL